MSTDRDAADPTVEFFILADRAETVGGKLYMMGGLIDQFSVPALPATLNFGFALSVLADVRSVDAGPIGVRIDIAGPSGNSIAVLETQIAAHSPVRLPGRDAYRVLASFPLLSLVATEWGGHRAEVKLNGRVAATFPFTVQQVAQ